MWHPVNGYIGLSTPRRGWRTPHEDHRAKLLTSESKIFLQTVSPKLYDNSDPNGDSQSLGCFHFFPTQSLRTGTREADSS